MEVFYIPALRLSTNKMTNSALSALFVADKLYMSVHDEECCEKRGH